ncbi:MAG: hypothetical protein ACK570_09145 [Bacteroidota bacterium]
MLELELSYPNWYIILCIIAGTGLSLLLYFRDQTFSEVKYSRLLNRCLLMCRAILLSILFILLLSPLLKIIRSETEKPLVVILKDGSQSLPLILSAEEINKYHNTLRNLAEALSKDYEVQTLKFGSTVQSTNTDSLTETATDLSEALTYVFDNNRSRNLGAIIIASDGIYNKGSNPLYLPQLSTVPVFTIPVGDTSVKRDVTITKVNCNPVVYLGNNLTMQIFGKALSCSASSTTLTVTQLIDGKEKKLFEKNIVITNNQFPITQEVILLADRSGVNHYRVRLSEVDNEITTVNNVKDVFVEVQQAKDQILIMADGPHPDLAALNLTLQEIKNYEAEVHFQPDYPSDITDYKLVIFHQLPTGDSYFNTFIAKLRDRKIPHLFIMGSETVVGAINNAQNIFRINGSNAKLNTVLASFNKDFALFTLSDRTKDQINMFPPLQTLFGDYRLGATGISMLTQKIGNVATSYPLMAFASGLQSNSGIIAGEGIWRWRLYDYQKNKNHDAFNELIRRCIQYLVSRSSNKPFRVYVQNESGNDNIRVFGENEPVTFNAELYNESGELVNIPDVKLSVKSKDGKDYDFQFNKTYNAYSINTGSFINGDYTWSATTTFNNRNLSESGTFRISPIQLESINLTADDNLMYQLAANSGGAMFPLDRSEEIINLIKSNDTIKPVIYSINKTESVINLKWLFALLLLLLSAEWFLRKYNGSY